MYYVKVKSDLLFYNLYIYVDMYIVQRYICTSPVCFIQKEQRTKDGQMESSFSLFTFFPLISINNKYASPMPLAWIYYSSPIHLRTMEEHPVDRQQTVDKLSKIKYLKNTDPSFFHG